MAGLTKNLRRSRKFLTAAANLQTRFYPGCLAAQDGDFFNAPRAFTLKHCWYLCDHSVSPRSTLCDGWKTSCRSVRPLGWGEGESFSFYIENESMYVVFSLCRKCTCTFQVVSLDLISSVGRRICHLSRLLPVTRLTWCVPDPSVEMETKSGGADDDLKTMSQR